MSENQYGFKYDDYGNTSEILVYGSGSSVNGCSFINKGTAFSGEERVKLGMQASLPPGVRTLEDQIENSTITLNAKHDDVERYIFLRSLYTRNVTLAHALIKNDIKKYLGIIYTPTIGEAVTKYSSMFRQANGLHFYPGNIDSAEDILRRYLHRDIRVAVVTDNQGVLGIGDQGVGGIAICLGKLMQYTQGAGIAPWHCLPISLDVGTDNEELLSDDKYLGWRQKRLKGEEYLSFIGRFVRAFRNVFPNAICQWEDFSRQNAFSIRDAFAEELISFNDDIQGSGSIALAAILTAMKIKKEFLQNQVILINGAGTVGIGIAQQVEAMLRKTGLSEKEAIDRIFTVDSSGLVVQDEKNEPYKKRYAKITERLPWYRKGSLDEIIQGAGVTILVGASGDDNYLNKKIIELLKQNTKIPVLLPLTTLKKDGVYKASACIQEASGECLFSTGLAVDPLDENNSIIRQCNNFFVFPGVGLGVLASGAREILPDFFTVAAETISKSVSEGDMQKGALLPALEEYENISLKVAHSVAMEAVRAGVSRPCVFSGYQHLDEETRMKELIYRMRWRPEYLPLTAM